MLNTDKNAAGPGASGAQTPKAPAANFCPLLGAGMTPDDPRAPCRAPQWPGQAPIVCPHPVLPRQEWLVLANAVKARLRRSVGGPGQPWPEDSALDSLLRVREEVLDSLQALDFLSRCAQRELPRIPHRLQQSRVRPILRSSPPRRPR